MITNVPGPGSYEPKTNNKLPEFTNFGTKRLRQCSLENYTSEAPPVGLYSPKSDKNSHAATYVFNSETERLNASIDFTVGPGNYEANCDNHQQFSFNKTDRFKFDFFRGKLGVGPAHYRLKSKEKSKTVAVEAKAKRFAPLDRQNPDFYAVSINENSSIVGITSLPIKNYNAKAPFNSSDIRFPYARDYWIKKTGAPDPGHYSLDKNDVKPKFFESKIPRFVETLKSEGPGPGAYEVRSNPLKS